MEEVESAEQVDDTHVRWTTKIGQHARDWQSEIVEQKPDQCIEWRNVEGPVSTGRVEVEALGTDSTRVTFTVESEATSAGEGQISFRKTGLPSVPLPSGSVVIS